MPGSKMTRKTYRFAKGRLLQRKRPSFASQKVTFYNAEGNTLTIKQKSITAKREAPP